jgi:hypothetical protein
MKSSASFIVTCSVLVAAIMLAGCASTPERRIARNPDLFASFPTDVQERVRAGQVELGFSPEMVSLALGRPDSRVTQRSERGEKVIWYYEGRYLTTDTVRVHDYGRFSVRDPVIYVDRTREHRYTRARLEFVDGRLTTIQQVER